MPVLKTVQLSFTLANKGATGAMGINTSETGAGEDFLSQTQTVLAASWNAIAIGNCASADLIAIKNLDATNYIEIALDNAGASKIAKLTGKANGQGRFLFLPLAAGVTLYAKANTANCVVQVAVAEP